MARSGSPYYWEHPLWEKDLDKGLRLLRWAAEPHIVAFAGDRGLLHPELTTSATAPEAAGIAEAENARGGQFAEYASSNRT